MKEVNTVTIQLIKHELRRCSAAWVRRVSILDIATGRMAERRVPNMCSGSFTTRHVLAILAMLGFVMNGMIQHSVSVAIFALKDPALTGELLEYSNNITFTKYYCSPHVYNGSGENASSSNTTAVNITYEDSAENYSNESSEMNHDEEIYDEPEPKVPLTEEDSVAWTLQEAFIWGTLITPLPGSRLALNIGPKKQFGWATLGSALCSLLVPAAWNTPAHVMIRVIQGMLMGLTWPAIHMLAATWFPPLERSQFVSCYTALYFGSAMSILVGAPFVRAAGSNALFYALSILGAVWFILWSKFVFDSPMKHPRISDQERRHIENSTKGTLRREKVPPLPLRSFLTAPPVWACAVAVFGSQWGQTTLFVAATKYLKLVYGFAITNDSILSALPLLGHFLCAITFGRVVDHVRTKGVASTTTCRKLLVYISHFFPGAILFVVGYSGCDPAAPASLFTAAVGLSGATAAGAYASALEIAPNFAGTVFGLCQTFGAAGSLLSSFVIREGLHGWLPGSWRLIFGLSTAVLLGCAVVFLILGSGTVQPWNLPGHLTPAEGTDPADAGSEGQLSIEEGDVMTPSTSNSVVENIDGVEIIDPDEGSNRVLPHTVTV